MTRGRAIVVASLFVVLLIAAGLFGPSRTQVGDAEGLEPFAARALVVAIPRLTWEDVEQFIEVTCSETRRPSCAWAQTFAEVGATNSLRAIGPKTSLPEGYVTLGAGNRATVPARASRLAIERTDGSLVALGVDAVIADAEAKLYGAEPGALGQAIHDAGLTTAVFARTYDAVLAVMDREGMVDEGTLGTDDALAAEDAVRSLERHELVLVELSSLDDVQTLSAQDPRRQAQVSVVIRAAFRAVVQAPRDAVMIITTPAAPNDRGQLGVFTLQGATTYPDDTETARLPVSVFQSATTRRPGYVTLTDVAPTILTRLGLDVPRSMNGTPVVATATTAEVSDFAEIDRLSRYRDSIVGPVSVVYVVMQVIGAVIALLAIRRFSSLRRLALTLACAVLAVPPLAFLSGLVPYHRMARPLYVVSLFAAAMVAAVVLIGVARRRHASIWMPALVLVAFGLAVQLIDIVTGGRLQINTPFGYSPIVAGRFQGYGNLSFAMAAAAAVIVATAAPLVRPRWDRSLVVVWAATVGAVIVVCDGLPAYGADVGGVLALIPAFVVVCSLLAGRRVGVARLAAAGAGAVGVLVLIALVDMSRPAGERTHLGRFVARLLDGDGGIILRRKAEANIGILTSSVWTWLVPVIVVFFVLIARRRVGIMRRLADDVAGFRAFLLGSLVLAVIGFAVNDSGVAIPAAMAGLVLPWVTAVALALPRGSVPRDCAPHDRMADVTP
jgi:hypothetical protein